MQYLPEVIFFYIPRPTTTTRRIGRGGEVSQLYYNGVAAVYTVRVLNEIRLSTVSHYLPYVHATTCTYIYLKKINIFTVCHYRHGYRHVEAPVHIAASDCFPAVKGRKVKKKKKKIENLWWISFSSPSLFYIIVCTYYIVYYFRLLKNVEFHNRALKTRFHFDIYIKTCVCKLSY